MTLHYIIIGRFSKVQSGKMGPALGRCEPFQRAQITIMCMYIYIYIYIHIFVRIYIYIYMYLYANS